jgi:hypothetical protein
MSPTQQPMAGGRQPLDAEELKIRRAAPMRDEAALRRAGLGGI